MPSIKSLNLLLQGAVSGDADIELNVPPDPEILSLPSDFFLSFKDLPRQKRQPEQIVHVTDEQAVIAVANEQTLEILYFTDKFFLTTFQEARNEKLQVIETFGEPHVSFFG